MPKGTPTLVEAADGPLSLRELADRYSLPYATVRDRYERGDRTIEKLSRRADSRFSYRDRPQKQARTIGGAIDYSRLMPKPEDSPLLPFDIEAKR